MISRLKINRQQLPKLLIALAFVLSFVLVYLVYQGWAATYYTHNISISPAWSGTVKNTSGTVGALINCPTKCSYSSVYSSTASVTYKAYPATGYKFAGWEFSPSIRSGYDYTSNPLSVRRNGSKTFTAKFVKIDPNTRIHTFQRNTGGGYVKNTSGRLGLAVSCPSDCTHVYQYATDSVSYTAFPYWNHRFLGWEMYPSVKDGIDYTVNTISIPKTSDARVTAMFQKLSGQALAQAIVNRYVASCPILTGITVTFDPNLTQYQALSYYGSGRIVVSPTHTASLETIMRHEIYHIYDYRDNGRIDWGENVPPANPPACMAAVSL